ncbi:KOW domain-containing RNA-binding protein [Extibacter muris]|uniref:RNA-binding protein n=1 Tax=Extibacter muris TaxID=1796622 RepID=A0A4V2WSJ5_9FIRM|nr:KOW domain-containing RNA-binding protein [Extibacter muris]MCU0078748.1 KOW domain-containing RNA-binding protein [Extibacter muris]TDA21860.1 RNA-binding protein [Extibacter muris]
MEEVKTGMLAKSKAGHDKGQVYVIMDTDDAYVYLADGRIRTLERLKKKKKKHIQPIKREFDVTAADDAAIKQILKNFNKDRENQEDL